MLRAFSFLAFFPLILLGYKDASLLAQDKKQPLDSDSTSLLPSAMEVISTKLRLPNDLEIETKVQYTVQGKTIFILPSFVAGKVERSIEGNKKIALRPSDRLLPPEEKRSVKLHVTVENLLDNQIHEKEIIKHIRDRVIQLQGLDSNAMFQITRPIIKTDGIRFSLITAGLGNDDSPTEVVLANTVSRPLDNVLTFNIDPIAVRKIEKDHGYDSGLICSALNILPTGQIKVKFERLEMDGQVSYLRATIDDFQKRVGSMVNPDSKQSPDVIIPLGNSGNAEIKNKLSSMLRQSLQVTVSTRQGGTDLPLMPFLEKAIDGMLESSKVDMQIDQQRATFLLDNQVTITSTIGEIKNLSRLDEKKRSDLLKKASDHYYASRKDQKSNYTGSLNVGYMGYSVGLNGGRSNSAVDDNENHIKEQKEQQKEAFDKLLSEFDGKVPTLTGIKIDDLSLTSSTKQIEARFQQNSFFVDYTLHKFSPISLIGAIDGSLSFTDIIRQYAILRSDYDSLLKIVGTPAQIVEAKENIERLKSLADELKMKSSAIDEALDAFDKNSKALLGRVDQNAVIKLQKEVSRLKAGVSRISGPTFSNIDSAFKNLDNDEPPPGLDCLGTSVEANTVMAAQNAWANFLNKKSHLDAGSITQDSKVKLEMVLIPAGKFIMGSPKYKSEPPHEVTITKPFYMGKYEVTQEQWESVMGKNPSETKGAKLPVTHVSWEDCQNFIKKLNAKTKVSYRLPTEAEWEYACRAGTTTFYSVGDSLTKAYANIENSEIRAVGSYKPNTFGLYDMHGNVWEWCEDWYRDYPTGAVTDPKGPATGEVRVLRGASFYNFLSNAHSSYRYFNTPSNRDFSIGFRLARTP